MSCKINNSPQPAEAAANRMDITQQLKQNALPSEQITNTKILARGNKQAKQLNLKRGQYRVKGWVAANEYKSYSQFKRDVMKLIPQGNEKKRVFFRKIDVGNRQEIKKDGQDYQAHPFTLVFTVIDNPIPLEPVIWGASIIGSATAGWFFVDKVETFTETGTGSFISIIAGLATLGGLYLTLRN